ncbi:mitochondrial fission ELM1 family protein [Oleiphilus messinensis]|nr:mitochondrial fission ELM1 family protein [Oleiphilus messinensis]
MKLNVWMITDGKPGHQNQLRGLGSALANSVETEITWLHVRDYPLKWRALISRKALSLNLTPDQSGLPDIVIGAGHATHKLVLSLKRQCQSFTVLLMKPSLPYRLFDACIVPAHDSPPNRPQVLKTLGVLNTITPRTEQADHAQNTPGLMLIGGESKHYHWDTTEIVAQISEILQQDPEQNWMLTNSRRTPEDFLETLSAALNEQQQLTVIPHTETPPEWMKENLVRSNPVWVTPDSVSMVYEALTSGAQTGIFKLKEKKHGRIVRGLEKLVDDNKLITFEDWHRHHEMPRYQGPFFEAGRAADWLLERYRIAKSG